MERDRAAARPALIVSTPVGPAANLLWSLMITSARHSAWPGDVPIIDGHAGYGLPTPCFIRTAKIATLDILLIERKLGRVSTELLAAAQRHLATNLGLTPARAPAR